MMGKVYTPEQVAAGALPEPEAHFTARDMLLAGMARIDALSDGVVYGTLVYGSVALGHPNIRSDLDALIVIHDNDLSANRHIRKLFGEIAERTRVSIEGNVWGTDDLGSDIFGPNTHTIDPAFLNHLRSVPVSANLYGEHPAEIIVSPPMDMFVLFRFIAHKKRQLSRSYYDSSLRQDKAQRALELAVALARRTLTVMHHEKLYPVEPSGFNKTEIVQAYEEVFDGERFVADFQELLALDREYSEALTAIHLGQIALSQYESAYQAIVRRAAGLAYEWLLKVDPAMRRLFVDGRPD